MTKKSLDRKPEAAKRNKKSRQSNRPKVTKKAKLVSLLSNNFGVDIAGLSKKLGWQTHSTRAAMTGLRKSGYVIELTKTRDGEPTRYHIISVPAEQGA